MAITLDGAALISFDDNTRRDRVERAVHRLPEPRLVAEIVGHCRWALGAGLESDDAIREALHTARRRNLWGRRNDRD